MEFTDVLQKIEEFDSIENSIKNSLYNLISMSCNGKDRYLQSAYTLHKCESCQFKGSIETKDGFYCYKCKKIDKKGEKPDNFIYEIKNIHLKRK